MAERIGIASDHAGYAYKELFIQELTDYDWQDYGPGSTDSVDYPSYAQILSQGIVSGEIEQGILICGSGIGMCIAANKAHPSVHAALVHDLLSAQLSKEHNNSNVLCIGQNIIGPKIALEIARIWLSTEFSQAKRHATRVKQIEDYGQQ